MITQEVLELNVFYDKHTGVFTRRKSLSARVKVGDVAGSPEGRGYLGFCVNGKKVKAHRMAWVYVHGSIPKGMDIDHINGVRNDNKIENLRLATRRQNLMNQRRKPCNTSGFKGVQFCKKTSKWKARCRANGKDNWLGYFDSPELAHAAYAEFAKQHHREFFCGD